MSGDPASQNLAPQGGVPNETGLHQEAPLTWVAWDEARRIAYGLASPLPHTLLPLADALGEILGETITAEMPVPHYTSAATDGWALVGEGPWTVRMPQPAEEDERLLLTLPPDQRILPVVEIRPGEATYVTAGGAVPFGATAVLPAHRGQTMPAESLEDGEAAQELQDGDVLEDAIPAAPLLKGQNIRAQGEEFEHGDALLRNGCKLNPSHIGLAASAGHDVLPVLRRPRVTVLLGAANVVESGIPTPGEVRDVLGPQLPAVLQQVGAHVDQVRRVPHGAEGMHQALNETISGDHSVLDSRAQIVVTTGGTGHGEDDHVRSALESLGAQLIVDGVAQEPAHGVILAKFPDEGPLVLALPGSPLSAMTGLLTVGHALIAGATGATMPPTERFTAAQTMDGTGSVQVIPAYFQNGRVMAEPWVGPTMMSGLAHADVLMVVPTEGLHAGHEVEVLRLPWRS